MTQKKIQVFINGKKKDFNENYDLFSLLNLLEINESGIAVEINLNVIPKSQYKNTIIKILETKVRPAVARDGGDIKFKDFRDGKVIVELQGSCSGCPSSTLTLKKGVENLLCHYVPEVKEVEAI